MKGSILIEDIYDMGVMGTLIIGTVKSGILKLEMNAKAGKNTIKIKVMQMGPETLTKAEIDNHVGIKITGAKKAELDPLKGTMLEFSDTPPEEKGFFEILFGR